MDRYDITRACEHTERHTSPWIAALLIVCAVACILAQIFDPQPAAGAKLRLEGRHRQGGDVPRSVQR